MDRFKQRSHFLLDYYPLGLHERSSGCENILKALKATVLQALIKELNTKCNQQIFFS